MPFTIENYINLGLSLGNLALFRIEQRQYTIIGNLLKMIQLDNNDNYVLEDFHRKLISFNYSKASSIYHHA